MVVELYSSKLRNWRRGQCLKQSALANMIGVTQAAVSRWESGIDVPSLAVARRIEKLMRNEDRDAVAIERLFMERNTGIQALFDIDGVRLEGVSAGFRGFWPTFSKLLGCHFADAMVGESRIAVDERDIVKEIMAGDLVMISGVSLRHLNITSDSEVIHTWHARFRKIGGRTFADIVYVPCDPNSSCRVTEIIRRDALQL